MNLKFDAVDFNGGLIAVFNDEPQPRAGLLSKFLEAIRPDPKSMLNEIKKAKSGAEDVRGYTYNDIDVDILPGRIVLEELYPTSGNEEDAESTEITLEEAEKLIFEWQTALEEYNRKSGA